MGLTGLVSGEAGSGAHCIDTPPPAAFGAVCPGASFHPAPPAVKFPSGSAGKTIVSNLQPTLTLETQIQIHPTFPRRKDQLQACHFKNLAKLLQHFLAALPLLMKKLKGSEIMTYLCGGIPGPGTRTRETPWL